MSDIYSYDIYSPMYHFDVSRDDMELLYKSIEEFNIFLESRKGETLRFRYPIAYNLQGKDWNEVALWAGLPRFSNIKYLINDMVKDVESKIVPFEGSNTDLLCRTLNQKYISEYKSKMQEEYENDPR